MAETLVDVLRGRAAAHPHAVAARVDGGRSLTFGLWREGADRVAGGLVAHGAGGAGRRVGLLFANPSLCEGLTAYAGILASGAAVATVPPTSTAEEIERIRSVAGLSAIVCCGGLATDAVGRIDATDLLTANAPPPRTGPSTSDIAEILFTSGTTGVPKGVVATHGNLVQGSDQRPVLEAGSGWHVHAVSPGTNLGQTLLRVPIMSGDGLLVLRRFDPRRFVELVASEGPVATTLVPTMASWLLESAEEDGCTLTSLRRVTVAGAPSTPRLMERLSELCPNAVVRNGYGSTESWPAATFAEVGRDAAESVGQPGPGHAVTVVDEAGRALGPGEVGEVVLRAADGIPARWYWEDDAATTKVFGPDGVRMGDLGHLDDAGTLFLTGRLHDRIVVAGRNVSSLEVEDALSRHPAVVQCSAFGVPDEMLGQHVSAAVVTRRPVAPIELREFVGARLSRYKVPLEIHLVDHLPVSSSGKILKRELVASLGGASRAD